MSDSTNERQGADEQRAELLRIKSCLQELEGMVDSMLAWTKVHTREFQFYRTDLVDFTIKIEGPTVASLDEREILVREEISRVIELVAISNRENPGLLGPDAYKDGVQLVLDNNYAFIVSAEYNPPPTHRKPNY